MINKIITQKNNSTCYTKAHKDLMGHIKNNISTIILLGKGGHGKSHLINECKYALTSYEIYDGNLYNCNRKTALKILLSKNKKIVSCLTNPYEQFDIKPNNCVIVYM